MKPGCHSCRLRWLSGKLSEKLPLAGAEDRALRGRNLSADLQADTRRVETSLKAGSIRQIFTAYLLQSDKSTARKPQRQLTNPSRNRIFPSKLKTVIIPSHCPLFRGKYNIG